MRNDAHIRGYGLSYAKIIAARVRDPSEENADQFPYECIGVNSHTYEEDVTVETKVQCTPGQYIIYVEFDWSNSSICNDFSFRVYSGY